MYKKEPHEKVRHMSAGDQRDADDSVESAKIDSDIENEIVALSLVSKPKKQITQWKKEPGVKDLKADLEEASSDHDAQVTRVGAFLDNLNITGSAVIKKRKGYSSVAPKLIRKQAEWRYASLSEPFLGDSDLFETDPVTYEDKKAAIQNGLVLNNQFNTKIDKVAFIDSYVRTAVDEGTVIVRVGWEYEEVVELELQPIMVPAPVSPMDLGMPPQNQMGGMEGIPPEMGMEAGGMAMGPPMGGSMPPQGPEQGMPPQEQQQEPPMMQIGEEEVEVVKIIKNQPTVTVCEYTAVVIDPTCNGDISKANFIAYKFDTSLAELERSGLYSNLKSIDPENVSNSDSSSDISAHAEDSSFSFKDKSRKKLPAVEYWGYWDVEGDGVLLPIVATWIGDVMIRMEENPYPDGDLPFVIAQYLPKRFSVYGEPDGALLVENQRIVGAVTRGMIDIMGRSAAGQKGRSLDALDITNQRKYEAGQDYEFAPHISPDKAFYDHKYPEIPNSAMGMLTLQNAEAESLTGVKAFAGGISGNDLGDSATAARGALDAASKRELGILRRLASGIIQIGRKIIAMNGEFLGEQEVVRITNEEFIAVDRDDLAGEIDIRLNISTAETDNAKAQELAFMLQTMGNSMPPEMSQLVLSDIARLRKMPELSKKIQDYKPEPDPLDQEMKQLAVDKLKAEIQEIQAETIERQARAELDKAKARAQDATSDMSDLDFVEKESGVTQQRELEKQSATAASNKELKLLDMAKQGRSNQPNSGNG